MIYQFIGYAVLDSGVQLLFRKSDGDDASVFYTDAELAAFNTLADLRNSIISRLQRKVNRTAAAAKLDPLHRPNGDHLGEE